jgi:RNase P protein component
MKSLREGYERILEDRARRLAERKRVKAIGSKRRRRVRRRARVLAEHERATRSPATPLPHAAGWARQSRHDWKPRHERYSKEAGPPAGSKIPKLGLRAFVRNAIRRIGRSA